MSIFTRKKKVDVRTFVRHFLQTAVFTKIGEIDPWMSVAEVYYKSLIDIEPSFVDADFNSFCHELLALRLEAISTAWTNNSINLALPMETEMKKFVTHESDQLWDMIGDYNQATAEAVTYDYDSQSRTGRAKIVFINTKRTQLFDEWSAKGYDDQVVARTANRIDSIKSWTSGVAPSLLAITLARRLEIEPTRPYVLQMKEFEVGFYGGASGEFRKVKVAP